MIESFQKQKEDEEIEISKDIINPLKLEKRQTLSNFIINDDDEEKKMTTVNIISKSHCIEYIYENSNYLIVINDTLDLIEISYGFNEKFICAAFHYGKKVVYIPIERKEGNKGLCSIIGRQIYNELLIKVKSLFEANGGLSLTFNVNQVKDKFIASEINDKFSKK